MNTAVRTIRIQSDLKRKMQSLMNKLIKRGLLGLAAVAVPVSAAVAMSPAAFASTAHVDTTTTGPVNGSGYVGTLHHTNTTNSQWSIDNYSLHVVGSYGWTNDFVLNVQTPVSGNHSAAIVTGSVTDTTEYGTSTANFTVPSAEWLANPVVPFQTNGQNITVDNGNWYGIEASYGSTPVPAAQGITSPDPAGFSIFNAEYNMVYSPVEALRTLGTGSAPENHRSSSAPSALSPGLGRGAAIRIHLNPSQKSEPLFGGAPARPRIIRS